MDIDKKASIIKIENQQDNNFNSILKIKRVDTLTSQIQRKSVRFLLDNSLVEENDKSR